MTLTLPLDVTLITARGSFRVGRQAREITFRTASPGGFASATLALDRPLSYQPPEVAYYGRMIISDTRSGATVWEGYLEDPGRTASSDGTIYELTAIGPSGHTRDRKVPLIYVDRRLDAWEKLNNASGEQQNTQVKTGTDAGGTAVDALILSFPTGMTVPTSGACTARYPCLINAGQEAAVFDYSWDAGLTSASWLIRGFSTGAHVVRSQSASTSGSGTSTAVVGSGAFALGDDHPILQLQWTGAASGTGASDVVWASIMNVVVRAITYGADGTKQTSGYTSADKTILASTVVADLLGRLLPKYDGATATITATTHAIDQLAYPDGVTPYAVLEDLLKLETGFTWHAWEQTAAAGKHRFEWVAWPSTVRYEADVRDGFASPGSGDGLYDQVLVRWRDPTGRIRTTTRTQSVPDLTAAGRIRQELIDLGDEVGSSANADRAGDQFLIQHQTPPNAGRLTIARPIRDLVTGRMVYPWEIRAGALIRVRGVGARLDALNAVARDGVTVFRVVGTDFRASSGSVDLSLDSVARTATYTLAQAAATAQASARRR